MSHIRDIEYIAQSILKEQCIFVCGSDLSKIDNKQPDNKEIVELFIRKYENKISHNFTENKNILDMSLPEVSQKYFDSLNDTEEIQNVATRISKSFLQENISSDRLPSTTHLLLANLGIRDIYTTNYDKLIERAYEMVGFQEVNLINFLNFEKINSNGLPNIYKLCGTVGSEVFLMEQQFSKIDMEKSHFPFMRQIMGKIVIFIGYNKRDVIVLKPYIEFIKTCFPNQTYCLVPNESEKDELIHTELFKGLPGLDYVTLGIEEFIIDLRIKCLSETYKYFTFFSSKRKLVESHGLEFLIKELKDSSNEREIRINTIRLALEDHQGHLASSNNVNTWYYDYKFHCSLYEEIFKKDFSELYLKLEKFYSNYQSSDSLADHSEIFRCLESERYDDAIKSLNEHIENAINNASFWYSYVIKFCDTYKDKFDSSRGHGGQFEFYQLDNAQEEESVSETDLYIKNRILLVGSTRSDNTSFVFRYMLLALAKGTAIPIYIDCNIDCKKSLSKLVDLFDRCDTFDDFLVSFLESWALPSALPSKEQLIRQRVKSGQIVFIVDGISRENINWQSIADAISRYQEQVNDHIKILVTSRCRHIDNNELAERMGLNTIFIRRLQNISSPSDINESTMSPDCAENPSGMSQTNTGNSTGIQLINHGTVNFPQTPH
jgi:hypothetical protein